MKTSIEKMFAAGFGLALLVLVAVGLMQYRMTQHLVEAAHLVAHTDEVLAQIQSLLFEVKDAESGVRGYVATGDEKFLIPYQGTSAESAKRLKGLRQLTSDNASQQKRLDTLEPLVSRRFDHLGKVLQSLEEGGLPAARDFMEKGEGLRLTNSIIQVAAEMENEERRLLVQRNAAAEASTRRTNAINLAGTLVAIGLLFGAALIIARDTANRKKAEEAVRRASAYNRSLIEASLDPLVTISPDGKITDVNEATIKVTGVRREELVGTDFSDYFTEPEKAREGYQQVFAKGFVTDYPLTIRHRDGRLIDVLYNASVYKDVQGNVLGVFAAARDVTESKQVTRELAETKNFLDNVLQSSIKYSIIGKDLDRRILSWNEGARRNYGYTAEEILGKDSIILHTSEDIQSGAVDKLMASAKEKGLAEGEFQRVRKDGSRFTGNVVVTRRNDASGHPVGYLVMSSDISEKKRAEEQILKLNAELEERVAARTAELTASNKELESFTYAVAHDLRSPLRHIQGFSSLLIADYASQLDESARRYLGRIQQGVERMARLLEDLLNLSRLGRQELRLQVCGLNSVVEETVNELKAEIKDRQVEWRLGRLPFVECDPSLMKLVFTNLLSNAVKFTRPREKAVIEVDQVAVDGQPAVFVRDNGVGFSMQYADKLFGIFQRLHRQEDFEGTGVGLATVQRIIDKHGGRVWAEAELDKGATFYFALNGHNGSGKIQTSLGGGQ